MEEFYKKHAKSFGDNQAIKLLETKVHEAKEAYKEDPKDKDHYMGHLAELWEMIDDFFECKDIDPKTLLQG